MKLELLLQREDFHSIFTQTLKRYLTDNYEWNGEIIWGERSKNLSENFLVNEKINLIFPKNIKSNTLRALASEYGFNKNILKYIAQQVYIYLSTTHILRGLLSSDFLTIQPFPELLSNTCILPGNNSIRLILQDENECIVLLKDKFNEKRLKNTIRVRLKHKDIPGPKILNHDIAAGWYIEEKIVGLPINRMFDYSKKNAALVKANAFLNQLYERTSYRLDFKQRLDELKFEIDYSITKLAFEDQQALQQKLKKIIDPVFISLKKYHNKIETIEMAMTHGDFQDANILLLQKREDLIIQIIDWEHCSERSINFDAFVYNLKSRSPRGFADRVASLIVSNECPETPIVYQKQKRFSNDELHLYLLVFILEELLFRLEESNFPSAKKISSGLEIFLDELSKINF